MDIISGDTVQWEEPVWGGYSPGWGGRRSRQAQPIGQRTIRAVVVRESYGARTGQHTFSLRVLSATGLDAPQPGQLIRRMGRNLYGRVLEHIPGDSPERQRLADDKHTRGERARRTRWARWLGETCA